MKLSPQVVKKINEYYTFCKYKYQAHTKAAEKYNELYIYTTAPIIVLSSITTILASYNSTPSSDYQWIALLVAVFSGITTVCQSLASFLEFKNKYQEHFTTATKYLALARMIENEFYITYYNSDSDDKITVEYIKNLFEKIYAEFLNIQSIAPGLPSTISDKDFSNAKFGIGEVDDVLIDMSGVSDINSIDDINGTDSTDCMLEQNTNANRAKGMKHFPNGIKSPTGTIMSPPSLLNLSNQSNNVVLSNNMQTSDVKILTSQ